jgi:amino acid efflux transporter
LFTLISFFHLRSGFFSSCHFEGISSIAGFGRAIPNPYKVWGISAMLLWAFKGWDTMSFGLGELQNPEKKVRRIFWLSFGLVIFIYIMLAITSIGADAAGIPLSGASGLVELVKLTPFGNLLIWLISIIIIDNITSWNFASSRLLYASSVEGVLPSDLGKLSKSGQLTTSILSMYVAFLFVLLGAYLFRIPISFLIMLVNQNCILLYGFILFSYWKIETGRKHWVYSGLSLLSLSFLVSGFTWEILYSIALIGIGYYGFVMKTAR